MTVADRAADPVPELEPARTILDHVLTVWPPDADRAATADLAARLATYSTAYAGWQTADLTRALRAAGVNARTLKIRGRSARGCYLAEVQQAAEPAPVPEPAPEPSRPVYLIVLPWWLIVVAVLSGPLGVLVGAVLMAVCCRSRAGAERP